MEDLTDLVVRSRKGDSTAYEQVVRRFQDMAVGYAYSLSGDWQEAEDIAQEAFISAYYTLDKLRDVAAFPGWFRQIVFTHAHRRLRVSQPILVSLEQVAEPSTTDPMRTFEQRESRDELDAALQSLTEAHRSVILLYYINDYSQKEIATFLNVPIGTVKTRLYHARKQLKMRISTLDHLSSQRPSRDAQFTKKVMRLFDATKAGDIDRVKALLQEDQSLAHATGFIHTALWGSDALALHVAVMHGRKDIVDLLLANGADINVRDDKYHFTALIHAIDLAAFMPDYAELGMVDFLLERGAERDVWACSWQNDQNAVKEWLDQDPSLVNQVGPGPSTLLSFCRGIEAIQFLLDYGADPFVTYPRRGWLEQMSPMMDIAYRGHYDAVRYLLNHLDMDVDIFYASIMGDIERVKQLHQQDSKRIHAATPDNHALGARLTPLHLAAQGGHIELVEWLLEQGVDINAKAFKDLTPLHFTICYGQKELLDPLPKVEEATDKLAVYHMRPEMPALLIRKGADLTARDSSQQYTPLELAQSHFEDETDRSSIVALLQQSQATS